MLKPGPVPGFFVDVRSPGTQVKRAGTPTVYYR